MPKINLLPLKGVPIYQQLQIEEALLRADDQNWCLFNRGSAPAIVLGISGKPEMLVNREKMGKDPIPLIRRFSGGGTVVVDDQTLFITFICNQECTQIPCFPNEVHCWAKGLYSGVFEEHDFNLRENDYVFGDRKFGGNAQYLQKKRWLHHSTLLWDFCPDKMEYLLLPEKRPKYREDRGHLDFLCRLSDFVPSQDVVVEGIVRELEKRFEVDERVVSDVGEILERKHRKATALL